MVKSLKLAKRNGRYRKLRSLTCPDESCPYHGATFNCRRGERCPNCGTPTKKGKLT